MENNKRIFGDNLITRVRTHNESKILTTPEAIVREHRERWLKESARPEARRVQGIESRFVFGINDRATPTIRQINRKLRILNTRWMFKKFFRSINWNVAIKWLCSALAVLALVAISGVVFFGPTTWREFWK